MTAATTWVTAKQEVQGTVESLICIILEGVFETNCGNLRRAWVVYRRAMTVALPYLPLKRIDPEIDVNQRSCGSASLIWTVISACCSVFLRVHFDKGMGAMSVWRNEPPLGKFECLLTVIVSRILERNECALGPSELTTTQSIDAELLKVSKSMPAGFLASSEFPWPHRRNARCLLGNPTPRSPGLLLWPVDSAPSTVYDANRRQYRARVFQDYLRQC